MSFSSGDSAPLAFRTDTIRDFSVSQNDVIELPDIEPEVHIASSGAASTFARSRNAADKKFRETTGADADVNVYICRTGAKGDALLFADMNGDNTADLGILLTGLFNQTNFASIQIDGGIA